MIKIAAIEAGVYQRIVFLTGAGVSVASGLNAYRGPGGLWEQADIARIADADNLPGTLPDLWRLYSARRKNALAAQPNAAHTAIAKFQQRHAAEGRVTLITQNVDNLHQRAGSADVLELHGSAFRSRCFNKMCRQEPFLDISLPDGIPPCPTCGGPLRPDVVLFGESLSERILGHAVLAVQNSDLFITIGTSGVVWPAAAFAEIAANAGARTININVEPSHNPAFQEEYLGPAERILPALLALSQTI